MSDTNTDTETSLLPEDYTPREIAVNDLDGQTLEDAFEASMVQVEDGQLVAGSVVKIGREAVVLDFGFQTWITWNLQQSISCTNMICFSCCWFSCVFCLFSLLIL